MKIIILYSKDEDDCVSIIISKEDKTAEIHGISNFESCLRDTNQNVGSTLLKITLKMLKKYKEKLGIDLIILTDNSIKQCNDTKKGIRLSIMLTLLTGDTWYGALFKQSLKTTALRCKYGFRYK